MASISHLDDLPRVPGEAPDDPSDWRPLRAPLGLSAFGVNAFGGAQVGDVVIEAHDEVTSEVTGGHEELYVVVRGALALTLDGESTVVPAGGLIAIPDPAVQRSGTAAEPDTVVLAVGAAPGAVFTPSGWELRELRKHGLIDEA